ncbi:MAG: flagellar hook-basal body complex protein, partial [Gammaproteobacteria bacterium]
MPFNVALTGIRAASVDLEVTGNNIANASTVGYKQSRVEFGDLYANSFLSLGTNPVGDGVRVQNIRQSFAQGNIDFTENGLDLAINGGGFFILSDNGATRYSRAGQFGVDKDGYVVNSVGMRLQGFSANDQGVIGGVLGDLVIQSGNLAPRRTTNVDAQLNLDSSEGVLAQAGYTLTSDGTDVGQVVAGTTNGYGAQTFTVTLGNGTTTTVTTVADESANSIAARFNQIDGIDASASTSATLTATGFNNASGTMRVTINGVPFDNPASLTDLANSINNSPSLVGVSAVLNGSDLVVRDSRGNDLSFTFSGAAGDSFEVQGAGG